MIKYVCISVFLCIAFASSALAAVDDVLIKQQVHGDAVPPTTPTLLSAIPVASSQIDLVWSTSTDDVLLSGYRVFRDAAQIATTTLTTYSDTGLTASTAYSYFIQAFDSSVNISSSSNALATTTLQSTPTSTQAGADSGGSEDIKLVSLEVTPGLHTAQVSWETNRYVQFELRWGRTASYELGFVTNELFKRKHTTQITSLEPGTVYEYQLVAYDRNGKMIVLSSDRFRTLPAPDQTPPSNVRDLQAEIHNDDITLSWINPTEPDFSYVRVVRSHLFYPSDPYDGFIAYQGTGTGFTDRDAALKREAYYYTVFSYDREGNVSSGAVVRAESGEGASRYSTSELTLAFDDFELIQEGTRIAPEQIDANLPFTIRIAYEKLPEHLKSIIATLSHPTDKERSFSFLLRINKDKTYYEAGIGALYEAGSYPVSFTIFDYETLILSEVSGTYVAVQSHSEETLFGIPLSLETKGTVVQTSVLWLFLLVFLLVWLYHLIRLLFKGRHATAGMLALRLSTLFVCVAAAGYSAQVVVSEFVAVPQQSLLASASVNGSLTFENVLYLVVLCILLALFCIALWAVLVFIINRRT